MKDKTAQIISLAVIIEAIITYINQFFVGGKFCYEMLLSIILGIIISAAYEIDIPKCLNLDSRIPYFGSILTGILFSRGSNYIHDILKALNMV